MALVTTVIPVFNGEKYLRATLDSLARQTRKPDRVIVLDDGSTDATPRIAREYQGLKVDYVLNPTNLGLFPNHNRALEFARETDYLNILHANDVLLPRFFERVVGALESSAAVSMAFSQYGFISDAGEVVDQSPVENDLPARMVDLNSFLRTQAELKALMINAVVMKSGRQPLPCQFPLDMAQVGDCVFHAHLATSCQQILLVPEILTQYRLHPAGATKINKTRLQSWVVDEWRAMRMISGWMRLNGPQRWVYQQKLRALFAARACVKVQITRDASPEFAAEIVKTAKETVGPLYWLLGNMAVALRDLILYRCMGGQPSPLIRG